MTVVVFLGPTLPVAVARAELDAVYLPPVAQGDVYRVARGRPFAIGIIDGYFERLPAVWHKEILWAMASGVHVFGAASMGALRAAELERFGMQGVGAVFAAFRDGELEDDDEVAVAHGDASAGFRAGSEALVNIRATLRAAVERGALPAPVVGTLIALAKGIFYPERSFPALIARARETGVAAEHLAVLRDVAVNGRVDQKRADALELLRALRACRAEHRAPSPVAYSFARTDAWDQLVTWADAQPPLGSLPDPSGPPPPHPQESSWPR